jgi:hypothetical protein
MGELVKSEGSAFRIAQLTDGGTDVGGLASAFVGLLGGEELRTTDMEVVKIPGSGGRNWEIPDPLAENGVTAVPSINGVILFSVLSKAFFEKDYEERDADGGPPECVSLDGGRTGIASFENITKFGVGGDCVTCPMAQWTKDGDKSIPPRCSETLTLYVLQPESLLPIAVRLPRTSRENYRKYTIGLLNRIGAVNEVTTKIGLTQLESKNGIPYSQATFSAVEKIPEADRALVYQYSTAVRDMVLRSNASFATQLEQRHLGETIETIEANIVE